MTLRRDWLRSDCAAGRLAVSRGPFNHDMRFFGRLRCLVDHGVGVFDARPVGASLLLQVAAPVAWFPALSLDLGVFTLPIVQGWIIPIVMAFGACGVSMAMPNISAMISRSTPPDRQGAMLGLNMASGSIARIFGPMLAGALFSGLGHDWPFIVGAILTIPAAIMAVNAGRAMRRSEAGRAA